jgi:hypothetical protein
MAKKTTQLDRKKADKNKDGKLSKYEELTGEAVQDAMADDPEQDEKVMMSCGGMATMGEGMMSDQMPIGATSAEVADDIEAMISENEYVLPANVVKWHGLKHIMDMQNEAEMGLMMMHGSGLIQEVESGTEEESDSTGAENAEVSDEGDSEQEEQETFETPEGNEVEVAGITTVNDELEIDETEEYKTNNYGKQSHMFGAVKKPRFTFIV